MRIYNYKDNCDCFFNSEIVSLLTQIHEYKGKQNVQIENNSNAMAHLLDVARVQSVADTYQCGEHIANDYSGAVRPALWINM